MQTTSHALIGAVIAQAAVTVGTISATDVSVWWVLPLIYLVGIAGSVAPDVVMIPLFVWDKVRGRKPMTVQGPVIMAMKEMSHSLPVWVTVGLMVAVGLDGVWMQFGLLFVISGLVGGVLPDIPTHSEERYRSTDCTFMYPLTLLGVPAIRWPHDRYEYRYDFGVLWPLKEWELTFNIILLDILALLILAHLLT